ncbi:hypothetical protein UVI_02018630 [Ustilaginoidea virens]|uniref:Uncharacterized protein n=1 Tax=Ustilaginoidea virens TaxID=1159556 RepID=A0A1B5KUV0_USTVR|nr:hypothetical protein UVI_02018630 [Ustilaginoidea virens]
MERSKECLFLMAVLKAAVRAASKSKASVGSSDACVAFELFGSLVSVALGVTRPNSEDFLL